MKRRFYRNAITAEFKSRGWKGSFVETSFEVFLEEKVESSLFPRPLDEEANDIIDKTGLMERLIEIRLEIEELKQAKQTLRLLPKIPAKVSMAA